MESDEAGLPSGTDVSTSIASPSRSSAWHVFLVFLRLGVTSFGGPLAHIGYFHAEFVRERRWLSEEQFNSLVALCNTVPGPASSQVSMALGFQRAGLWGLVAAFVGLTFPSALLMALLGAGASAFAGAGWVFGLKAAAVAVVAHALFQMARSQFSALDEMERVCGGGVAVAALIVVFFFPSPLVQVLVLSCAGLLGALMFSRSVSAVAFVEVPRWLGYLSVLLLAAFSVLFTVMSGVESGVREGEQLWSFTAMFWRAGSLVFGGGHAVLPLLEFDSRNFVDSETFLSGYAAAQAMPGPLFTFSSFLGAAHEEAPSGALGALVATLALFLPGALILLAALTFMPTLTKFRRIAGAFAGVSVAVVGILGAAFISPVIEQGILGSTPARAPCALVLCAVTAALMKCRVPMWAVVGLAAVGGELAFLIVPLS